MTVPVADQERLSHILADDLQTRIQWAYDLEQEIATLSGGGLTSWGLASQATYVYAGDPNGNVTAVTDGDFLLDTQTPALWLADGPGTSWTQASGGGGGAVSSVNSQTGAVVLTYTDVGADAAGAAATAQTAAESYADGLAGNYDAAGAAAAAQAASQPLDSDLTAIAALTTTSFGRSFLALADAAAGRTLLALGTAATSNTGDFDAAGAAAAAQAASQPLDSDLTAIAALTTTSFGRGFLTLADAAAGISKLGLDADLATLSLPASTTISTFGASLIDDTDASTARGTLGLGGAAVLGDPVTAAHGGTGLASLTAHALQVGAGTGTIAQVGPDSATTKPLFSAGSSADPAFRAIVVGDLPTGTGSSNVPVGGVITGAGPTGDASHTLTLTYNAAGQLTAVTNNAIQISESQVNSLVSDLALKAPLASPALTGTPTAPTATPATNSTQLATTAYADAISASKANVLTPTAVKTATTYTAAAGDFVPCDTTSNAITVTLPNAPADKTVVGVKHVIQAGTNSVTIACAGSDVFNKAGGATSASLPNLAESYIFQYKASGAIWYIVEHDSPRTAQYFESLVALNPASMTDLQTQTAIQAAQIAAQIRAFSGYFVYSGLTLTASGTAGKLDMAAGVSFVSTTELNAAAQTAISTTITSLADATNPKWVAVELDTSNVVQFNQGTAAAAPAIPSYTASRVPLGLLYVPANATAVDVLYTTNNGKAKLYDVRQVVGVHPGRVFATDTAQTTLTNPTTLTTILASAPSIPANSLNIGDVFQLRASGTYKNTQNNSTIGVQVLVGGSANILSYTTATLNLDASNARRWILALDFTVSAIGSGTSGLFVREADFRIAGPTSLVDVQMLTGGGANGDAMIGSGTASAGFDTTAALTLDLKFVVVTSSSTSTFSLRNFSVVKVPH